PIVPLELSQNVLSGAEVERTNAGERAVALRRNARQVFLSSWVQRPVVAWKGGAALEERWRTADDRRVLDAELRGGTGVACDELRVRHIGLQGEIGAAELRITARVRREEVGVDPADGPEERRRLRDRWRRVEVQDDVV